MPENPWKLSTLFLALALAIALGLPLLGNAEAQKHPQPHMRAALTATRTAIRQLEKSTYDKAGHRAAAIGHLERAESEIVEGMEAANASGH